MDEARRALPYLARIIRDASEAYQEAQRWRRHLNNAWARSDQRKLGEERDAALRRLNSAIDECNAVGADLVDLEHGVVHLDAEVEGRTVNLTWRLGEPIASAWREDFAAS